MRARYCSNAGCHLLLPNEIQKPEDPRNRRASQTITRLPPTLTRMAEKKYLDSLSYARGAASAVILSGLDKGKVKSRHQTNRRLVEYFMDLAQGTCSCREFQESDIPFRHAITVIQALHKAPMDYMPLWARFETWQSAYQRIWMLPIGLRED